MSLTINPSTVTTETTTNNVTSGAATATPSGGRSPYSYAWTIYQTDGFDYTITNPSSATTAVTAHGLSDNITARVTLLCTCQDSTGLSATGRVIFTFQRTAPPGGGDPL